MGLLLTLVAQFALSGACFAKGTLIFRRLTYVPEVHLFIQTAKRLIDEQNENFLRELQSDLEAELQRDIATAHKATLRNLQKKADTVSDYLAKRRERLSLYLSFLEHSASGTRIGEICSKEQAETLPRSDAVKDACATLADLSTKTIASAILKVGSDAANSAINETVIILEFVRTLRRSQYLNIKNVILRNYPASVTASLVDPPDKGAAETFRIEMIRNVCSATFLQSALVEIRLLARANFRPVDDQRTRLASWSQKVGQYFRKHECGLSIPSPSCSKEDNGTREYFTEAARIYAKVVEPQLSALETSAPGFTMDDWRLARNIMLVNITAGLDASLTAYNAVSGCQDSGQQEKPL